MDEQSVVMASARTGSQIDAFQAEIGASLAERNAARSVAELFIAGALKLLDPALVMAGGNVEDRAARVRVLRLFGHIVRECVESSCIYQGTGKEES